MSLILVAELVLTALDGSGSVTTIRTYTPSGNAPPAVDSAARLLIARLQAISGCAWIQIDIIYRTLLPKIDGTGAMAPQALFIFDCDDPEQHFMVSIPGILPQYIDTSGDMPRITLDDPAIIAFTSAVIDLCCNPFGYDITTMNDAVINETDYPSEIYFSNTVWN